MKLSRPWPVAQIASWSAASVTPRCCTVITRSGPGFSCRHDVVTSTTQIRIAVSRPWRGAASAEVGVMAVILFSYVWLWHSTFPGAALLILALYFGLGIVSHVRRGESARDIGVRIDNFPRAI